MSRLSGICQLFSDFRIPADLGVAKISAALGWSNICNLVIDGETKTDKHFVGKRLNGIKSDEDPFSLYDKDSLYVQLENMASCDRISSMLRR